MKQTRVKVKRLPVLVALSLAVIMIACAWLIGFVAVAHADETSSSDREWYSAVTVTNSSFSETDSGTPAAPSDWTGSALNTGSYAISGVVSPSSYAGATTETKEKYGNLDASLVKTPFDGDYTDKDSTNNMLFINASSPSAYGYTSSDVTFEKSAYYSISVYVKTSISNGSGASVTVSGLEDENVGIVGIKTNEWTEYTLYLATSSIESATGNIVLGLGSTKDADTCTGVAFFDELTVKRISAKSYFTAISGAEAVNDFTVRPADGVKNIKISLDESENALFDGFGTNDFTFIQPGKSKAVVEKIEKNGGINGYKDYGFDRAVYPAFDGKTTSVLALSTPVTQKDSVSEYSEGYASATTKNDITVARSAYYRISGWFFAQGDDTPSVKLEYTLGTKTDDKTVSLASTTSSDDHNDWQEFTVFVKGSDLADCNLKLSLMMGTEDDKVKGAVLFEEIRMMQITPALYSELSSSATGTLEIDSEISTGITNGSFDKVGDYGDTDNVASGDPLVPENWTKTVSTGDEDKIVSGLVDCGEVVFHYTTLAKENGNALKIKAENAAVSYASETFTVAADSYNLLSVDVYVKEKDARSDRGAVIYVKRDGKTVGSIEKIRESGRYNLYIKGGSAESTLSLEIGLGKADKPATGTVYFTRAGLLTASGTVVASSPANVLNFAATADEFDGVDATYNDMRLNNAANVKNATVSLVAGDMSQFDSYTDADLKTPYNWSLTSTSSDGVAYGIFDSKNRGDGAKVSNLPDSFKPYGDSYPYALVLRNGDKAYSYLTLDNAYTLAADSYYKLTMAVKTYNIDPDASVGAFVSIGDDYKFNFTSTAGLIDGMTGSVKDYDEKYIDYENYTEYVFYIKTSSSETTSDIKVGLGGDKFKERVSGTLVLGYINLEQVESVDYEDAIADLDDDKNLIDAYTMRADFSTASDEDDETPEETAKGEIAWWLIPSILLGVAVVIAVVGTFIRKKIENRPKKPVNPSTRSSYDRRNLDLPEDENADATSTDETEPTDIEPSETTDNNEENATEETVATEEPSATEDATATEEASAPEATPEETPAETPASEPNATSVEPPSDEPAEENK